MSSYPDLDKAYAKCKFKRYTRDGRAIPCLNARCPNPLCRRKGAEKQSIICQRSAGTNPPKWCAVLRVDDELPLDIVLLLAAVIFLLVHPLRARTRVFTDRVEVTTFFRHQVASRAEVRGVRGGLIGPVLELADGTRIRTTAPIPAPSWLKNTPEG